MGESDIIRDYLDGTTIPELALQHHHTNRTISRILREAGVLGTLQRRRDEAKRGLPSPAHLGRSGLSGQPTGPQWAYIAGLLDGEGSIVARGDAARGHARYVVSIVQKDPTPLEWMQSALGAGAIHFANGTHRYNLPGQRAVFAFLAGVERHLIVKRATAEAALAALEASYGWERMPGGSGKGERTQDEDDSDGEGHGKGRAEAEGGAAQ